MSAEFLSTVDKLVGQFGVFSHLIDKVATSIIPTTKAGACSQCSDGLQMKQCISQPSGCNQLVCTYYVKQTFGVQCTSCGTRTTTSYSPATYCPPNQGQCTTATCPATMLGLSQCACIN